MGSPWRSLILLAGALLATAAQAQVSGSIALVSDYRFRGVSLSDSRPALQGGLAYDRDGGWYGGAFASTVRFDEDAHDGLQLIAYAGRVLPLAGSVNWEAGIAYSAFSRHHDYDYPDLYAGIVTDAVSARIHYASGYFGQGAGAVYAEINGAQPMGERLRLVAHAGVLRLGSACCRSDIRAGVAFAAGGVNAELSVVTASAAYPAYPIPEGQRRSAVVLALNRSF